MKSLWKKFFKNSVPKSNVTFFDKTCDPNIKLNDYLMMKIDCFYLHHPVEHFPCRITFIDEDGVGIALNANDRTPVYVYKKYIIDYYSIDEIQFNLLSC